MVFTQLYGFKLPFQFNDNNNNEMVNHIVSEYNKLA